MLLNNILSVCQPRSNAPKGCLYASYLSRCASSITVYGQLSCTSHIISCRPRPIASTSLILPQFLQLFFIAHHTPLPSLTLNCSKLPTPPPSPPPPLPLSLRFFLPSLESL